MIFRRDKKRRGEPETETDEVDTAAEGAADNAADGNAADGKASDVNASDDKASDDIAADEDAAAEATTGAAAETTETESGPGGVDLEALDALDWRDQGPWDIREIDDLDEGDDGPKIDLGSMILTGVPGSELRLQVAEDTQQIVSAMLIIESTLDTDAGSNGAPQTATSALELGAYAAPRSGDYWAELREEISEAATAAGGSAALNAGPFGVELFRLFPVTTPDGEEGYQPSKMWVAEGPRWLLRGIVYGQAAIEESDDSTAVTDVAAAFRKVIVRRDDEAMAPGDLLPIAMPTNLVTEEPS